MPRRRLGTSRSPFSGGQPGTGSSGLVLPDTGASRIVGVSPTIIATANRNILAGVGGFGIGGVAPSVIATQSRHVLAGVGALAIAGKQPSIAASGSQALLDLSQEPTGFTSRGTLDGSGLPDPLIIAPHNTNAYQNWGAHDGGDVLAYQAAGSYGNAPTSTVRLTVQRDGDTKSPKLAGMDGTTYWQVTNMPGDDKGGASAEIGRYFTTGEKGNELFISFGFKLKVGFENDVNGSGTKFMWVHALTDGDYDAQFYWGLNTGTNPTFAFNIQGGPQLAPNDLDGGTRSLTCNLSSAKSTFNQFMGKWVRIQIYLKMNSTNTTPDGKLDVWFTEEDGTKTHVMSYTDLLVTGQTDRKWTGLRIENTRGGGPVGETYTVGGHECVSAIYVSTK